MGTDQRSLDVISANLYVLTQVQPDTPFRVVFGMSFPAEFRARIEAIAAEHAPHGVTLNISAEFQSGSDHTLIAAGPASRLVPVFQALADLGG